jgi:hypothetical protein
MEIYSVLFIVDFTYINLKFWNQTKGKGNNNVNMR